MIFISGPVVVSPSETITFHAYLPNTNLSDVEWWKIKDQSNKEVKITSKKYSVLNEGGNIYRFEIFNAEKKDSAAYQCIADNMKSNTIYVCVDGKLIYSHQTCIIEINLFKCVISAK